MNASTQTPRPAAPRAGDEARRITIPDTVEANLVEDLDITAENISFECGDNVVYPHHGAGKVLKKERRKMFGEEREYLTIKILHNDMTVMSLWRILMVRYSRVSPKISFFSFLRTLPAP